MNVQYFHSIIFLCKIAWIWKCLCLIFVLQDLMGKVNVCTPFYITSKIPVMLMGAMCIKGGFVHKDSLHHSSDGPSELCCKSVLLIKEENCWREHTSQSDGFTAGNDIQQHKQNIIIETKVRSLVHLPQYWQHWLAGGSLGESFC